MHENAVCPFKMYWHNTSQVSTKKRDLAILWWDEQFLLDYQAKGWMVGRYELGEHVQSGERGHVPSPHLGRGGGEGPAVG